MRVCNAHMSQESLQALDDGACILVRLSLTPEISRQILCESVSNRNRLSDRRGSQKTYLSLGQRVENGFLDLIRMFV